MDQPGLPGADGQAGLPWCRWTVDGLPGADGKDGKDGSPVLPGVDGKDGSPGLPGADGQAGLPGADGQAGLPGADGQAGLPGADGQAGLPGADGKHGSPGLPGADGKDGSPGLPGADGQAGLPGADGQAGLPGADGQAGLPGADGKHGSPGLPGADGKDGSPGLPGADGKDGSPGLPGADGKDGSPGLPGADGINGADGAAGVNATIDCIQCGERPEPEASAFLTSNMIGDTTLNANGEFSIAMGLATTALGDASTAIGNSTRTGVAQQLYDAFLVVKDTGPDLYAIIHRLINNEPTGQDAADYDAYILPYNAALDELITKHKPYDEWLEDAKDTFSKDNDTLEWLAKVCNLRSLLPLPSSLVTYSELSSLLLTLAHTPTASEFFYLDLFLPKTGSPAEIIIKDQYDLGDEGCPSTLSGENALATGEESIAYAKNSTAMGDSTVASGENSTAMGQKTTASGDASTAMGNNTEATADYSTAMGQKTTASGDASTAMGCKTLASGSCSTAMGSQTRVGLLKTITDAVEGIKTAITAIDDNANIETLRTEYEMANGVLSGNATNILVTEENAQLLAGQEQQPIKNPNGDNSWYFKSAGSDNKINWYFVSNTRDSEQVSTHPGLLRGDLTALDGTYQIIFDRFSAVVLNLH